MAVFDALERQIVAALQLDPRCPWRKMAAVLGEAERTVARRGSQLLESGAVAVVGIRPRPAVVLVEMRCMPGTVRAAANALSQRADTTFVYTTTGTGDCVAEVLPADKAEALRSNLAQDSGILVRQQHMSRQDNELIDALCADGRMSFEALGRRVGVSEATARRRSEWLLTNNQVHVRAIVEPASFGLAVEALLWIRASPQHVERVGKSLAELPTVRYAAAIAGNYQIMADVTVEDMSSLYRFITDSEWAQEATGVDVSILLDARKRGGRVMRSPW